MESKVRIAVSGKAGSGKDTFYAIAKEILEKRGKKQPENLKFARPLYDILHFAQEACGFDKEKDRKFLQWVGTEWAREKNKDVWVNIMERKILTTQNFIITDLRFLNELEMCKMNKVITVKIIRKLEFLGLNQANHQSEKDLDQVGEGKEVWDVIIENNSSLDDFRKKIETFLGDLNFV